MSNFSIWILRYLRVFFLWIFASVLHSFFIFNYDGTDVFDHQSLTAVMVCSKKCSKFTEENPFQSVTSIKLQSNFIEITPHHGFAPVNLLHVFRTPFPKDTSEGLLLKSTVFVIMYQCVQKWCFVVLIANYRLWSCYFYL